MKKIFYLLFFATLFVNCSDDKEIGTATEVNEKSKAITSESVKGEVPRDRMIYTILTDAANFTVTELEGFYKKDIATAEPDYATNLKNMWLIILNPRLFTEGNETQKVFFINEQITLNNNLAHFTGFYNLLASAKNITNTEKDNIANTFYEKNMKAIDFINWKTPEQRKEKEMDLVWAKRNFSNIVAMQK